MSDAAALLLMALSYTLDAAVLVAFTRIDRSIRWGDYWAASSLMVTPCALALHVASLDRSWPIACAFAVFATAQYSLMILGAAVFRGRPVNQPLFGLSQAVVAVAAAVTCLLYPAELAPVLGVIYAGASAVCAAMTWRRGVTLAEIVCAGLMLRCISVLLALLIPAESLLMTIAIASVGVELAVSLTILFAALVDYRTRMLQTETELRALNEKLSQTAARLERRTLQYEESRDRVYEADRAKANFLAKMGHELRTPLNAVIGYAALVRQPHIAANADLSRDYIENIAKAGGHLLSMVNSILDYSKLEFQEAVIDVAPHSIEELVEDSVSMIAVKAREKELALKVDVVPDLVAPFDQRLMRQVLLNCLSNAVKFTPDGGSIEITARPFPDYVELRVADSGPGISESAKETVFTPFWQDTNTNASHLGLGLGLSISRRIVEQHGGTIFADNRPEGGAVITIRLPKDEPGSRRYQPGDSTLSTSSAQ